MNPTYPGDWLPTATRANLQLRAHLCDSGSMTRPIGRPLSDASPIKVAVIGWLVTRPIMSRVDVPELPMSSAVIGWSSPPTPTP